MSKDIDIKLIDCIPGSNLLKGIENTMGARFNLIYPDGRKIRGFVVSMDDDGFHFQTCGSVEFIKFLEGNG